MTIGKFDRDLFLQAKKAKGATRRALMGRLVVENRPLTKILVAQLLGIGKPRPGVRSKLRVPGKDALDWDDAMAAGDIGIWKTLENLDLDLGSFSGYALQKIRYELQCAVARTAVVHVQRGQEDDVRAISPSSLSFEEDGRDVGFERLLHEQRLEDQGPGVTHGDVVLARLEAERQAERPREPALESFVRDRLAFGRHLRVAREPLVSAYEAHVSRLGGNLALRALRGTLAARGVRNMAVRVGWSDRPVGGYGGVALQSTDSPAP